MKNRKCTNGIGKWIYFLCLLLCVFMSCLDLNRTFEMKLVSDNIGSLALPATLAGRDWSGLLEGGIAYYGWGYYILFTPIFALTHNPVTIYTVVCAINIIVLGLISVLIFHIAAKFLSLGKSLYVVMLAVVSSGYVTFYAWNFTAELPSLLVVWLTAWLVLKAYSVADRKKAIIFYSALLALLITYSYNIHTRLIILLPAVIVACLFFYIVYKKWCIHFPTFLGASALGFLIARILKAEVINSLWNVSSMNELRNATINVGSYVDRFTGTFKVVLDIWLSNLFKLNLETYGILTICVIVIVVFFYKMFFKRDNDNLTENHLLSEKVFILLSVFGAALAGTIITIPLYYASSIAAGYNQGIENTQFSALTYIRYYYIYFGPIFVAVVTLIYKKMVLITWGEFIAGILGSVFLTWYVSTWVFKHLLWGFPNFYYKDFIGEKPYYNLWFSTSILLLAISVTFILIKCNKIKGIIIVLLLINIGRLCNVSQSSFFDIVPHSSGNATYAVISEAEKIYDDIPSEFYTISSRRMQFMLNWKKMIYGNLPSEDVEEAIVISERRDSEGTETLLQLGYQCFVLDENECIWIRSNKLLEELSPIISLYKDGTFCLREHLIKYHFMKIGKYVLVNPQGFIEMNIEFPADGEYTFCLDMDISGEHFMEIGYVDVVVNDSVIQTKELIYIKEAGQAKAEITFDVECVENLTLRVYFNESAIIRNFETEYTWSDE